MSYNKTKTDPELGQKIHEHLIKMGVETPTADFPLERKEKSMLSKRTLLASCGL